MMRIKRVKTCPGHDYNHGDEEQNFGEVVSLDSLDCDLDDDLAVRAVLKCVVVVPLEQGDGMNGPLGKLDVLSHGAPNKVGFLWGHLVSVPLEPLELEIIGLMEGVHLNIQSESDRKWRRRRTNLPVEWLENQRDDLAIEGKVLQLQWAGDLPNEPLSVGKDAIFRVFNPKGLLVLGQLRKRKEKKRKTHVNDFFEGSL